MSDTRVYKKVEIVGTSPISAQKAIENAVAEAARTLEHMRWFELVEARGRIEDGKVASWQATIRIGFGVERDLSD